MTTDSEPRDALAMMREWMGPPHPLAVGRALFEEALAAERRATVERIRTRLARYFELTPDGAGLRGFIEGTLDSLDEEAAA